MSTNCLDVSLATEVHERDVLEEYIVIGFLVAFILASILVLLVTKYIFRQLKKEKERIHYLEQLRKEGKYRKVYSELEAEDDLDFDSGRPLQTNYVYILPHELEAKETRGFTYNANSHGTTISEAVGNDLQGLESFKQSLMEEKHDIAMLLFRQLLTKERGTSFKERSNILGLFNSQHELISARSSSRRIWFKPSFEDVSAFHSRFQESRSSLLMSLIGNLLSVCCGLKLFSESCKQSLMSQCEQNLCGQRNIEDISYSTYCAVESSMRAIKGKLKGQSTELVDDDQMNNIMKAFLGTVRHTFLRMTDIFTDYFIKAMPLVVQAELKAVELITERWKTIELTRARLQQMILHCKRLMRKNSVDEEVIATRVKTYTTNVRSCLDKVTSSLERRISKFQLGSNADQMELCNSLLHFTKTLHEEECKTLSTNETIESMVINYSNACLNVLKGQMEAEIREVENFNLLETKHFRRIEIAMRKEINEILKRCEDEFFEALVEELSINQEDIGEVGGMMTVALKDKKAKIDDKKQGIMDIAERSLISFVKSLQCLQVFLSNRSVQRCNDWTYKSNSMANSLVLRPYGDEARPLSEKCYKLLPAVYYSDAHILFLCYATGFLTSILNNNSKPDGEVPISFNSICAALNEDTICDSYQLSVLKFSEYDEDLCLSRMSKLVEFQDSILDRCYKDLLEKVTHSLSPAFLRSRGKTCKKEKVIWRTVSNFQWESDNDTRESGRKSSLLKSKRNVDDSIKSLDQVLDLYESQYRMYVFKVEEQIRDILNKKILKRKDGNYTRQLNTLQVCTLQSLDEKVINQKPKNKKKTWNKEVSNGSIGAEEPNTSSDEVPVMLAVQQDRIMKTLHSVEDALLCTRIEFSVYERFVISLLLEKLTSRSHDTLKGSLDASINRANSIKGKGEKGDEANRSFESPKKDSDKFSSSRKGSAIKQVQRQRGNSVSTEQGSEHRRKSNVEKPVRKRSKVLKKNEGT